MAGEKDRILRFVAKGDVGCERAADSRLLMLDAGERGQIAVSRTTVAAMVQCGELRLNGGRLSLAQTSGDGLGAVTREIGLASVATPDGVRAVAININESPLSQLFRRRGPSGAFLSEPEFRAGERLRSDYDRASLMPRLGANWEAAVSRGKRSAQPGGMHDLTDAVLAARLRVERAVKDVGPELSGVLIDVCCYLKGMEAVEAERRWPARSAKLLLKAALGALSRHYEPDRRPRRSMVHWGATDFRPSIAGR